MPKGFFITGTDTGVGKTVIAGTLIRVLRASGTDACGMKPIETGCIVKGDSLYPSDGMFLLNASGVEEEIGDIVPYRFMTPAAPLVASEREGRDIDVDVIIRAFNHLSSRHQAIVIEGAGGLLVPIRRDYFMLHLAKDLGLPLIVVSRPAIGTINHTLLTVGCALNEGIEVSGIILNFSSPRNGTVAEETNPSVLESLCRVPLFGPFPYLEDMGGESLEKAALSHLETGELLKS
jgi:dethiobiotin synthetase